MFRIAVTWEGEGKARNSYYLLLSTWWTVTSASSKPGQIYTVRRFEQFSIQKCRDLCKLNFRRHTKCAAWTFITWIFISQIKMANSRKSYGKPCDFPLDVSRCLDQSRCFPSSRFSFLQLSANQPRSWFASVGDPSTAREAWSNIITKQCLQI